MKVRRGKFSGAIGNEVFVNTKHGQVVRSRPHRPPRATNDRLRARANLGSVASVWRTLSDQRFAAWAAAARKERMLPYRLFCQINGTLAAYGQSLVLDPPKRERLRPNPVEALEIRNRRGVISLRLRVPEAPAQFTFVFGVRWCSRGMSVPRSNGVLLGRLPQAVRGSSEITDLYVNKYGQPRPGSRVFVWTRQVINGRKDALKSTHADVPPPEKKSQVPGRAVASPNQYLSSKHVVSMFLGCSWLVLSFQLPPFPPLTPNPPLPTARL
jgi:hypothetical protein